MDDTEVFLNNCVLDFLTFNAAVHFSEILKVDGELISETYPLISRGDHDVSKIILRAASKINHFDFDKTEIAFCIAMIMIALSKPPRLISLLISIP